eukprot:SAG22_NODE_236_length_14254_cov_3.426492_4_plen_180_part_00
MPNSTRGDVRPTDAAPRRALRLRERRGIAMPCHASGGIVAGGTMIASQAPRGTSGGSRCARQGMRAAAALPLAPLLAVTVVIAAAAAAELDEQYRPRFHTPGGASSGYAGDPNGAFLHPRTRLYHLFWQADPASTLSGTHWGHAVSSDFVSRKRAAVTAPVHTVDAWQCPQSPLVIDLL